MKRCLVPLAALLSVLCFTACDEGKKTNEPASPSAATPPSAQAPAVPETSGLPKQPAADAGKPAGVPSKTYNQIKGIEQKHNADLEKELNN